MSDHNEQPTGEDIEKKTDTSAPSCTPTGLREAEDRVNSGKTTEFSLVSGAVLRGRKFNLGDEDVWSDEAEMKHGIGRILERITLDVIDPGPYGALGVYKGETLDWIKVLTGDRIDLLLQDRVFTYGPDYTFLWKCPSCGTKKYIDVDLNELLANRRQMLSEASRLHYEQGDLFHFDLPDAGIRLYFELQNGLHEKAIMRMQSTGQIDKKRRSLELLPRIKRADGMDQSRLPIFLRKEMSSSDACYLRDEMDRVDCGIDTAIIAECDNRMCQQVFEIDLPFGRGFLSPQKGIMQRRRERIAKEMADALMDLD